MPDASGALRGCSLGASLPELLRVRTSIFRNLLMVALTLDSLVTLGVLDAEHPELARLVELTRATLAQLELPSLPASS